MTRALLGPILCATVAAAQMDPYLFGTPLIDVDAFNSSPTDQSVVDYDADGIIDILTLGENVTFLAGLGDATFADPVVVDIAPYGAVTVVDADLDGAPDIILYDEDRDQLAVAYNDGTATFSIETVMSYETIDLVRIIGADLDDDGLQDLIVSSRIPSNVTVFRGLGNRAFDAPHVRPAGQGGTDLDMAVGDVSQDGFLDVVTTGIDAYIIFRGNGDGTLQSGVFKGLGSRGYGVVIDDFNADTFADMAIVVRNCSCLRVFLSDEDGDLTATDYESVPLPTALVYVDVTEDGIKDFVVDGRGIHENRLDGTPTLSRIIETFSIDGAADFNSDGFNDLFTGNLESRFSMALHDGIDDWDVALQHPAPISPTWGVDGSDVDGDGLGDISIAHEEGVWLAKGLGDGQFEDGTNIPGIPPIPADLVWTYLNDDDHLDLAVLLENGSLVTFAGDGTGNVQQIATRPSSPARRLEMADVTGDGVLDAIIGVDFFNPTVTVLHGIGDGTFDVGDTLTIGGPTSAFALLDVDGVNGLDLALASPDSDVVGIRLNDGTGRFDAAPGLEISDEIVDLTGADIDNDGDHDLLVARGSDEILTVVLNDGIGLSDVVDRSLDEWAGSTRAVDLDDDGQLEIVVSHSNLGTQSKRISVLDNALAEIGQYSLGHSTRDLVVTDLDGNGFPDLLAINRTTDGSITLMNRTVHSDCIADINGDGRLDVLDFVAFQLAWTNQDPIADCEANGIYNVLDFVCFQQLFVLGCL